MDPQQQQQQRASPPTTGNRSHSASGGRDDCWSEDASKTLIDAWGERYLHLNRGNLRQKDWKEVALAVNSRNHGLKPPRTDVQCKNRIDTLKKKYKLEKSRPSSASNWLFYNRLHYLIGNNGNSQSTSIPDPKLSTTTLTLTIKPISKSNTNPSSSPNQYSGGGGGDFDDVDDDDDDDDTEEFVRRVSRKQRTEETPPYKELARAILRFGEIYERIESSKQQQLMELEKQRMEFTKDLEFQRINMFTEAHLHLQKKKRKKPINNHTPPPPPPPPPASVKKL